MSKERPEHLLQCQLIERVRLELVPIHPELAGPDFENTGALRLVAIPNGGGRTIREGVALKMEGVQSGVPDLDLPIARGGFFGCRIEMKAGKGCLSPAQCDWLRFLEAGGHAVGVFWSVEDAFDFLADYMAKGPTLRGGVGPVSSLPARGTSNVR